MTNTRYYVNRRSDGESGPNCTDGGYREEGPYEVIREIRYRDARGHETRRVSTVRTFAKEEAAWSYKRHLDGLYGSGAAA